MWGVQAGAGFGPCALPDREREVVGIEPAASPFSDQADGHVAGLQRRWWVIG